MLRVKTDINEVIVAVALRGRARQSSSHESVDPTDAKLHK